MRQAFESVTRKGVFHLVLSESSSLDDFYARVMCDPEMRTLPWAKMHVWFFGDTTDDDSIQIAVAMHSGIDEANVHAGEIDGAVDCCVLTCSEIEALDEELKENCKAFLILTERSADDIPSDWPHGGVAHWFCEGSDGLR